MAPSLSGDKFCVFEDENIQNTIEFITQSSLGSRRERICVVSVVGKSSLGSNACKCALIDEVLGKNVFRGLFCEEKETNNETFCQIEGYFDARNRVIYLHLVSPLDTDILIKTCKDLDRDLIEKGFLQSCTDIAYNVSKSLLLLFLLSHIVVIVSPKVQFDLNYLQLFRLLDSTRVKIQPYITEMLRTVPGLSNDWIMFGRLCSPRVLFVFENYQDPIIKNKRTYEKYLEDQIYRFLRKSRIITNICSNSLFAICNQTDFVFITSKDPTIRDPQSFFIDLLERYCNADILQPEEKEEEEEDFRNFYSFLWSHVSVALTKGFDDNVGRHNVVPVFELPSVKEFFLVLSKLKDFFYNKNEETNKESSALFGHLRTALDTDTRFSEARCAKGLPVAMSLYQDGLPSHYTQDYHERKVAMAIQLFTLHARGPALFDYARQLREECDRFWQNGHQMCEVLSLTGNNCINPVHVTPEDTPVSSMNDEKSSSSQLLAMPHCSNFKLTSACDCGRRQITRDDPFTVRAANFDFYMAVRNKCSCGHLERVEFPVFQPSTTDVKPASTIKSADWSTISPSEPEFESQPDLRNSFTNLSQSTAGVGDNANSVDNSKKQELPTRAKESSQQTAEASKPGDAEETKSAISSEEDADDESDDDTENGGGDRERDIQLIIRESASPKVNSLMSQPSTTEYLPGMLHSMSPHGLLPKYSSWSLVCLGPSSLYSHNMGVQDQPGFISGTNFLLPWDVTVKLEHSGHLPPLWEGKRPPGIKNKKTLKDGTQFTVKIFIGVEYECPRGHRFMCSGPDSILKANLGIIKENANKVAGNDMPLYILCVCSRTGKQLMAQLMRIHVVTPKAPVHVTLNPRVQPGPPPCPIFSPGVAEPIRLSQSAYWVFRMPFVYEGDHGVYGIPKDRLDTCRLLKGVYGIADYISKPKSSNK